MANCENFKRPRQLGLSIHTSDVSLYDGSNLNCVDLPAGADLNDVIEAFGEKFCDLITLINAAATPAPAVIPNDPWVDMDETEMTLVTWIGSAVNNSTTIDMTYKIIAEDAVVIKAQIISNVTVDALIDSVNLNFRFPAFGSSNWFIGTKLISPMVQRVPVAIFATTPTGEIPNQVGTAIFSTAGGLNLISIGETNLQMASDDYIIHIHFECVCKLA